MSDFKIEEYCVGQVGTNCYLLINEKTKELLIVDPGDEAALLEKKIEATGCTPAAILLTHGHFDHAMAAGALAERYGILVYVHEADQDTLEESRYNLSGMMGRQESYHADVCVKDGQILELAGFRLKVLHTPGHTPGGCCYYIKEERVLLSGDTLFHESVGRTDFPRASMSELIRGIRGKLLELPDDTKVYPGHMSATTIGQERAYNPFI